MSRTSFCVRHRKTTSLTVVLEDIRRQARFAKYLRNGFMRVLMQEQKIRDEEELEQQKADAEKAQKRLVQIDTTIRKLLEQNVAGIISDECFAALMKGYEAEQIGLQETIRAYEELLESRKASVGNIEKHIALVEQYLDLRKLNARILNQLIGKILVHQRGVDEDGCPMQAIEIYYRFIGKTDIDLYDLFCPAA